jgi:hypothetical protein
MRKNEDATEMDCKYDNVDNSPPEKRRERKVDSVKLEQSPKLNDEGVNSKSATKY